MCVNTYWLLISIFSALTLAPSIKEYSSIVQWNFLMVFIFSSKQVLIFTLFIFPSKKVEQVTYRYCCSTLSQLNKLLVQPLKDIEMHIKKEESIEGNFTVLQKRAMVYPGILHMRWDLFSRHLLGSSCDENWFVRCKETLAPKKISAI